MHHICEIVEQNIHKIIKQFTLVFSLRTVCSLFLLVVLLSSVV